jgi:acetyltransferase-like isoleucine patch superfamily enzyme
MRMTDEKQEKAKASTVLSDPGSSSYRKYKAIAYGNVTFGYVVGAELAALLLSGMPGAAGLLLRKIFYRPLFRDIGRNVIFGRNVTIRHGRKIRLGSNIILDDNAVLDAKGEGNTGILIDDNVFVGRNTILNCKGGNIAVQRDVSISGNCELFSSNSLTIGSGTVIGAYSYLLSGGSYDYRDRGRPFSAQVGALTEGPLTVGANCWLGARVTVLDAASIGDHCVVGAGAVVTRPVPPNSLAVGVPAKVVRTI